MGPGLFRRAPGHSKKFACWMRAAGAEKLSPLSSLDSVGQGPEEAPAGREWPRIRVGVSSEDVDSGRLVDEKSRLLGQDPQPLLDALELFPECDRLTPQRLRRGLALLEHDPGDILPAHPTVYPEDQERPVVGVQRVSQLDEVVLGLGPEEGQGLLPHPLLQLREWGLRERHGAAPFAVDRSMQCMSGE